MPNPGVERIVHRGIEYAIVVRASYRQPGIAFFTPGDYSQQLGFMSRPAGYEVRAHVHLQAQRSVRMTLETLVVRTGLVRVDFYDETRTPVGAVELGTGDVVMLVAGGHRLVMLQPSEIIEVKQGPYMGDEDKELFEPQG